MKFAIIGHLLPGQDPSRIPIGWKKDNGFIITPELDFVGTKGFGISILLSPKQMMQLPQNVVRDRILNACVFAQNKLDADVVQLGGLTTSVTSGGVWVSEQKEFKGYVNHGDSYTAAVTCQVVQKALMILKRNPTDQILSIVGAYGVIGEAISKILVPQFTHSILIGRREDKLRELEEKLTGDYETTIDLKTKDADIIITVTSHPTALLNSEHLKKHAIIIDVSQPPNLTYNVCMQRPDVVRVDGGYVDSPTVSNAPLMPPGKIFACIAEVIMQAMENERKNHVGSIDLNHLRNTEKWGEKYGFTFNMLTNFGKMINAKRRGFENDE